MSDFFVNLSIDSHTRIVMERQQYKEQYEQVVDDARRADEAWTEECRQERRAHTALRRALHELLGYDQPDLPLTNKQLMDEVTARFTPDGLPPMGFGTTGTPGEVTVSGTFDRNQPDRLITHAEVVPEPYTLGPRVFKRGDTVPEDVVGLITSEGTVWRADVKAAGQVQFWNDDADSWFDAAGLLHMHGTLWELVNRDTVQVLVSPGQVPDIPRADPALLHALNQHATSDDGPATETMQPVTDPAGEPLVDDHGVEFGDADNPTDFKDVTDEELETLLLLVPVRVSAAQMSAWTPEQREQAARWAGLTHLAASDNTDVVVPHRPEFLDEVTTSE